MKKHLATTHHDSWPEVEKTIAEMAGSVEHGIGGRVRRWSYRVEITEASSGKSWELIHYVG